MSKLPYRIIIFNKAGIFLRYKESPKQSDVDGLIFFGVESRPVSPVIDGDTWREMTAAEIEAEKPKMALVDRLSKIMVAQSIMVKAEFAPMWAGVRLLLDQGEEAAARLFVESVAVPSDLEPAKAALLSEF